MLMYMKQSNNKLEWWQMWHHDILTCYKVHTNKTYMHLLLGRLIKGNMFSTASFYAFYECKQSYNYLVIVFIALIAFNILIDVIWKEKAANLHHYVTEQSRNNEDGVSGIWWLYLYNEYGGVGLQNNTYSFNIIG